MSKESYLEFEYSDVILSLLTTFDDENNPFTRSINLFNPKEAKNTWVFVDNLEFHLFVSIPLELSIERLRIFMIWSYWSFKYGLSGGGNNDDNETKGYLNDELKNVMISKELKELLSVIDNANRMLLTHHLFRPKKQYTRRRYEDENDEEEDKQQNNLIGSDVDFIIYITELESLEKPHLQGEVQYKITFDNHMILHYFLDRFTRPVKVKMNEDDDEVFILVKVMNFFRANDILPVRINYDSPSSSSSPITIDEYIENQITIIKEDLRKEKKRMDGTTIKKGDIMTHKLRFKSDFIRLDEGILHPSYHLKKNNKTIYPHKRTSNSIDKLVDSLQKSKHHDSILYQSLYIDLFDWINRHDDQPNLLLVDGNTRPMVISINATKKRLRNERENGGNVKKKVKSIHYIKQDIHVPIRKDYTTMLMPTSTTTTTMTTTTTLIIEDQNLDIVPKYKFMDVMKKTTSPPPSSLLEDKLIPNTMKKAKQASIVSFLTK